MVEYLIFQSNKGEILRITAMNARFLGCAVVYDTVEYHATQWYCNRVTIDSHALYWTMRKLILSLQDNIIERSYVDAMHHVGRSMAKFRVPHFDELIILDYKSMSGTLVHQDVIHIKGDKNTFSYTRTRSYESDLSPMFVFLTNIKAIIPNTPEESANLINLI